MNKKEALAFYKESLGEIERAGVKKNERIITTPQSAHIFADGKGDGYVATDKYTEAQYNTFWNYYDNNAGADFAKEIWDNVGELNDFK